MVVAKRMSKEELREDKVATAVKHFSDWARANQRMVIGIAVGVVAIVVGGLVYSSSRERAAQNASLTMYQGQMLFQSGNFAAALPEFEKAQSQYGSAKSTRTASLFIGNCQLALGNPAEAEKAFREFESKAGGDGIMKSAAARGLGSALFDLNKPAEAAAQFEAAAGTDGNLAKADDWISAANAWEAAGNPAKAIACLEKVVADHADSPRLLEVKIRLAEFKALASQ